MKPKSSASTAGSSSSVASSRQWNRLLSIAGIVWVTVTGRKFEGFGTRWFPKPASFGATQTSSDFPRRTCLQDAHMSLFLLCQPYFSPNVWSSLNDGHFWWWSQAMPIGNISQFAIQQVAHLQPFDLPISQSCDFSLWQTWLVYGEFFWQPWGPVLGPQQSPEALRHGGCAVRFLSIGKRWKIPGGLSVDQSLFSLSLYIYI